MNFGICEKVINHRLIVFKENRSKLVIENTKRKNVRRIEVDGCVLKEGLRCDYLMITENNTEYFIELKGGDVQHALSQLKTTINHISEDPKHGLKHCFIICTRHPALTPKIQRMKMELKRKFNSLLTIKGITCKHQL